MIYELKERDLYLVFEEENNPYPNLQICRLIHNYNEFGERKKMFCRKPDYCPVCQKMELVRKLQQNGPTPGSSECQKIKKEIEKEGKEWTCYMARHNYKSFYSVWHDSIGEFQHGQKIFWETPFNIKEEFKNEIIFKKGIYDINFQDWVIKLNYFEYEYPKSKRIVIDRSKIKFYKKDSKIIQKLIGDKL